MSQKDYSHVTTLTELGKKLSYAAKNGDVSFVKGLMSVGAPFSNEGVSN